MVGRMPTPAPTGPLGTEFEALYTEHFAFAWRMLLHFGVAEGQVEDAVQDVFVVVHRRLDRWDRRSARSWLYGIARRVAADHRRARARHQRKLDALPKAQAPTLERQIADRELLAMLEAALAKLDPGPREVFVMAEIEGMSAREIAELLELNPNTIASRLRRARAELARVLAQLGDPAQREPAQREPLTKQHRRRHGAAR